MTSNHITEQLKKLRTIVPDEQYARSSRQIILSTRPAIITPHLKAYHFISQTFNTGLSIVLTSLFFVLAFTSATTFLSVALAPELPGIGSDSLIVEADTLLKDIDINLSEARYFEVSARQTITALREASTNGPGYINPILIEQEAGDLEFESLTDETIDGLLEQIIL